MIDTNYYFTISHGKSERYKRYVPIIRAKIASSFRNLTIMKQLILIFILLGGISIDRISYCNHKIILRTMFNIGITKLGAAEESQ